MLLCEWLFTSYGYCQSPERHQLTSHTKPFFSPLSRRDHHLMGARSLKGGAVGLERKASPMEVLKESKFFFVPDNVSLNLLKVTLTFLKKIQHGVIVSWGDVTLEQKPLLTWLKVFFSLYVSRLPLLFRELWNRSKRHSVKEGSRGGGKGAPTLGGHYLHWSETHKDRVLLPPLKSRNRLESTFQCSK